MRPAWFTFNQQGTSVSYSNVSLHITGDTRVSIDPPCTTDARLSFKEAKLVEAFFLQAGTEGNGRFAGAHDQDRIVGVCIFRKAVNDANGVGW